MRKLKLVGYINSDTEIFLTKPKKGKYLKLVIDLDPIDIKNQLDKIVRKNGIQPRRRNGQDSVRGNIV